ncbi:MAG: DUF2207 domain-containing protein [Lewinellaceae bacterium]|nr:DUF2207 domain-containing protein [Lewinellaceae bacterium]
MRPLWLLLLLGCLFQAPSLKAEYFEITNYQVKVRISEEGEAFFDEIIQVHFFEERHGIFRNIPLVSDINGDRVTRIISDVKVDEYKFSTSKDWDQYVIKIGDKDKFVNGDQVYHLRYRILNPLNFFDQNIEFYWDLLGTQWEVPIRAFTFDIEVPARIALQNNDVRVFTGVKGSTTADARFGLPDEHTVEGQTTRAFEPHEGLTLAIRLPHDSFQPMSATESLFRRHGLLLAPIAFLLAAFSALFRNRNRKVAIMTEYFPPEGVSPAVGGGFVDNSVDTNDILCMIPLLASKGYMKLESEEGGFWSKDKVYFVKLKEADNALAPFEKEFFNALFSYGDRVLLSSLKDKFYVHVSSIRTSVKSWIKEQGWYEKGQEKWAIYTGIGGVVALIWGIYAIIQSNLDGIALIVVGIVLFFLASRFNKRSPEGNEMYRKMEGFRQFVKKADKPVIERLIKDDPLYYDKTLPYALAFGYIKRWNKQFEGLLF